MSHEELSYTALSAGNSALQSTIHMKETAWQQLSQLQTTAAAQTLPFWALLLWPFLRLTATAAHSWTN